MTSTEPSRRSSSANMSNALVFLVLATLGCLIPFRGNAATHLAASCSTSAVQAAINAAANGDTVLIPDGSCSWSSGITTTKQIWIRAQNYTPTTGGATNYNVTIVNNNSSSPLFTLTTGNEFHVRLSGIRFNEGTGTRNHLVVSGNGSKIALIDDVYMEVKQRNGNQQEVAFIAWTARGGVIWNARFVGLAAGTADGVGPTGGSLWVSNPNRPWTTASTMGMLDADGTVNLYLENSSCYNIGAFLDADDHARVVLRYNTFDGCVQLQTHGFTSAWGGRHVEFYNNTFAVTAANRNHAGRYVWIRLGTFLFTDNVVNNASNTQNYGSVNLFVIGDITTPGTYPQPRQPGWGHNGTTNVSDPIYAWNNTGARGGAWGYANGWESIVREGRDVFVNQGPKPGYTKYTFPHPARAGSAPPVTDTTPPTAPSSLTATAVSASQINLSWTASTDNVGVTGYILDRCVGSACTSFAQIGTVASVGFADVGLTGGTTYRYRVRATDAAGNVSADSNIASATTALAVDTTPPTAPANLSASPASASQINLAWSASTDNVGVTAYVVQRCQGAGCTAFSQIATTAGTAYGDSGLSSNTTYRYRVQARDAAGNSSAFSGIASATTAPLQTTAPPPLPQGNTGIAAAYPLDFNIESHPDVLFADGFESYSAVSNLTSRWNSLTHSQYTRIATEPGNVFSGTKALEFRVPQQTAELSNELVKSISPTEDVLFVRAYTRFEAGYNVVGSSHDGISVSSNYSNPGVPANGTNKFFVDVENSRMTSGEASPGLTHFYLYHPEQRSEWGDHWYPDGRVLPFDSIPGEFGPYFLPRPNFTPELNRWYCYEIMVKANTPGLRDGRIALWIDGTLVADFPNVRLRDVNTLKIDTVKLSLHIFSNTLRENRKWYDNVVISRSYVGPMTPAQGPMPPTSLQTSVH